MDDPAAEFQDGSTAPRLLVHSVIGFFRELKQLAETSELVMPGRSSLERPFASNALNKAVEGITFDMPPVTIHDLRRTGATQLAENGFDRDVIEKALAHEV